MLDTYFKEYFWTFRLLVLAILAVLSARAVNTVVAASLRVPPQDLTASSEGSGKDVAQSRASDVPTQTFLERNIFQAQREDLTPPPPEEKKADVVDIHQCEKSALRAKLTATVVSSDPQRSVAIFADLATNQPVGYYLGEKVVDQAAIIAIEWRKVKVDNAGHCETFSLEEEVNGGDPNAVAALPPPVPMDGGPDESKIALGEGVRKIKENDYEIPRAEIDNVLSNLNAVATQARIVPSFQNGKANGFKLFSIRPNSLYSKIGIQNGDIIQKINGYEINSPDKALEIYSKLKDAASITVDLIRRGKTQTMSYNIR